MAVIGIGVDVVDLVRAQRLLLRHGSRALERFLLPSFELAERLAPGSMDPAWLE